MNKGRRMTVRAERADAMFRQVGWHRRLFYLSRQIDEICRDFLFCPERRADTMQETRRWRHFTEKRETVSETFYKFYYLRLKERGNTP